jgi:RNA polymerase sigma-70 factor (ECF subfamily)
MAHSLQVPMDAELPQQSASNDVDAPLVAAARADPAAFEPLYRRYVVPIYHYTYRRLGSKEAAEDATAQIFTKALAAMPTHRPSGSTFRSWLFAIAHNVLVDAERARRPSHDLDMAAPLIDPAPGPEAHAIAAERQAEMNTLLLAVPPEQRRVLQLRLAGLSTDEIARALDTSPGAVRASQCRAVKRLRLVLGLAPRGEERDDA